MAAMLLAGVCPIAAMGWAPPPLLRPARINHEHLPRQTGLAPIRPMITSNNRTIRPA